MSNYDEALKVLRQVVDPTRADRIAMAQVYATLAHVDAITEIAEDLAPVAWPEQAATPVRDTEPAQTESAYRPSGPMVPVSELAPGDVIRYAGRNMEVLSVYNRGFEAGYRITFVDAPSINRLAGSEFEIIGQKQAPYYGDQTEPANKHNYPSADATYGLTEDEVTEIRVDPGNVIRYAGHNMEVFYVHNRDPEGRERGYRITFTDAPSISCTAGAEFGIIGQKRALLDVEIAERANKHNYPSADATYGLTEDEVKEIREPVEDVRAADLTNGREIHLDPTPLGSRSYGTVRRVDKHTAGNRVTVVLESGTELYVDADKLYQAIVRTTTTEDAATAEDVAE